MVSDPIYCNGEVAPCVFTEDENKPIIVVNIVSDPIFSPLPGAPQKKETAKAVSLVANLTKGAINGV